MNTLARRLKTLVRQFGGAKQCPECGGQGRLAFTIEFEGEEPGLGGCPRCNAGIPYVIRRMERPAWPAA
jgi:hypothetical protein